MDLTPLVEELAKPEYQGKSDAEAAVMVNAKTVDVRREVPTWQLKRHAIESGYWAAIKLARESADTPDQVRGLCLSVLDWIDDPSGKTQQVDLDRPAVAGMVASLVSVGLITQEIAAEIDAMADATIAWTQSVGLPEVGIGYVILAREAM